MQYNKYNIFSCERHIPIPNISSRKLKLFDSARDVICSYESCVEIATDLTIVEIIINSNKNKDLTTTTSIPNDMKTQFTERPQINDGLGISEYYLNGKSIGFGSSGMSYEDVIYALRIKDEDDYMEQFTTNEPQDRDTE